MSGNDQLPTLVPNRIDRDPAIIRGVTAPELYLIMFIALPTGLLAVLFFGLLFRSLFIGVALGMTTIVLMLVFGVLLIANIKRNKPLNYLTHAWHIKREQLGIKAASFIHKTTRFKETR